MQFAASLTDNNAFFRLSGRRKLMLGFRKIPSRDESRQFLRRRVLNSSNAGKSTAYLYITLATIILLAIMFFKI